MRNSFMFCSSANRVVSTPPCNSHSFYQSIRGFIGSRTIVETTVTIQSKVSLLGETYGRGLRKLALFLAFILLPMASWGGNETFTFPTSGSGTKGKSFSVTSTGTSNCGTIYYVSNSAETYASNYGLEATYLGVVFKPTQKCKLKINAGNDNSSDNTISLTIFSAADARLYKLFKDAVGADMGAYVLNNANDADKTWWKDYGKVLKISSKKIVVDDSNYAKYLSGQTANTNLRTQIFTMSLPAKGTKSGGTCETTIVNGETEYEFNANTEYCIYAHRGSSKIGFLSFTFVPVATTYTATFDANGGTVDPTSVTQTSVGASVTLPTPTLTGHSCDGWYTAKTGGTKRADAGGSYTPTASETLYAHWTPIAYNITYTVDLKGQSNPNPTTYTIESDNITFTNLPDVTGYTFDGWNPTGIAKGSTGDKEITGSWTPKGTSYTVTYMDNDKELGSEEVVENGTPSSYANFQTKAGYTFDKWYNDAELKSEANMSAAITAAKSFYGKWNPNTNTAYKVKHYQQNIENDEYTLFETDELTGTTAENVTPDVKAYTGFTAPDTQTKAIAADGSMVVEYQYTRNTYTLTWALDGGTITTAGTAAGPVKYGAPLTAPVVEKDGHIFSAWSPTVDATMPSEAKIYTAQWEALYTVTFAAGEGGSGSMDPLSKLEGVEVTLPACTFTAPAGKEFDKWTSTDVTITNGKFTMPAKPVTVTAQWFVNPCNAIGYGTSVALANNASKGTLSITSVGGTWETGKTPFSGAESSNWFISSNASNYMTGSLNDKYIQSITVSVSSSKSDKLKSAIVFSSAKNFDATKLVSYDGTNNVHLFDSKPTSSERATVEITAPVGAKSFAVGRNFSADFGSVDGEYQSSGSRYIYYVYACTAEEYTMSFAANGGSGTMESVSYPADMKVTLPECTFTAPTGKEFDGWNDGATTYAAGAEYTMGAKSVTLTAQWATKYTVTYMDGSTTLGTEKVKKDAQNAEYINYQNRPLTTFQGWYSDQSLETAVTMPVTVTADETYYGKWEKQYATTVDFMEEAVKTSGRATISDFLNTNHYALSLIDNNVSWDNATYGNVDCGLKVENVSRTLSFWVEAGKKVSIQVGTMNGEYDGDNNVLLSINGVAQTPIAQKNASNPYIYTTTQETEFCLTTRDRPSGYTANVTWNLFQKITITDNKFNVTYDGNGNTGGEAPVDSNNPHIGGTSVTVLGNATLEKTGYTFNCWNTKSDGLGDDLSATEPYGSFIITEATTLYAKWTINSHNLTWEVNGGTITSGESDYTHGSVAYGTTIIPPTVEKADCDFVGWNTTVAASMPDNDLTYTAQWKAAAQKYDISFNNGGHGTAPDGINASNVTLAAITGVTGYTCTGWVADVDTKVNETTITAGTLIENGTQVFVQQNTTFTAQWSTNTHKLAWVTDGDALTGEYTHGDAVAYGTTIVAPNTPTKTGYTFAAWDPAFVAETTMPDNDLTYTATWTAKQYTISYKDEGNVDYSGSNLSSLPASHTYGIATALVNGVREGYTFEGWFTTSTCDGTAITSVAGDAYTDNFTLYAKWEKINGNHYIYAFDDADHYVGGTYKTPEGKTAATDGNTHDLTNPYTLFSSTDGITSVVVNTGKYDAKTGNIQHICSYIKLNTSTSNIVFTIASGYEAVLKLKMGGYSKTPTAYLKDAGENPITASGTISGGAEAKNYAEITYNLSAGAYTLTTSGQNLYVSHIDLLATKLAADVSLADIKIKGTTIPGFASGNYNYNYKYAYKSTISASDVSYTATAPADVNITTSGNVPGTYVIKVSAKTKPELYKEYTINISEGPKDPTCILKATLTSGSAATLTGPYKDSVNAAINTSSFSSGGYKLGNEDNYAGFETKQGNQFAFLPGDVFNVYVVKASSVLEVYSDKGKNKVASISTVEADKLHSLPINFGESASFKNIYLYRTSSSMNPYITYVEVYRPMNPILTAIKITDYEGTEHVGKIEGNKITFANKFHFMTDLKNLNIAYTIASNDNSKVTKTIANQWQSGVANTLTLKDKDGDITEYTITVNVTPSEVVRTGLTAGKIVTYCNSKNVIAHDGAKFYYISGKATDLSSIELTEVTGELVAGYPYIVEAEKKEIRVVYGDEEETTAQVYNGLHGVLGATVTLEDGDYIIKNNKYYRAHTGNNNTATDGRAFLRLSEIESVSIAPGESTPAPSPRRIILGTDEVNISTGFNTVGETELGEPRKFIIHNQVVIIRNGQLYNAQGAMLR